jgi:fructuronate reductase/mannitol 2-dehydrogenase
MTQYLFGPEQSDAVLQVLTDERTRLVTMTITGSSYLIDSHSGGFQPEDDEGVASDLEDPGHPGTVFGYLTEALHRRRAAGIAPFTVLSCDNMQANGVAARNAIVSFARMRDEKLADWIGQNVAFPGSMVDRITPATSPEERDAIAAELGVDDRWPVVTEPFTQWVVEDSFCNGRPPLDEVGVQFVPDVTPYETMKTRLLNGAHCALGYLGYLAGFRTTDQVLADDIYRQYLTRLMADEIVPMLPEVPGIDLEAYQQTLLERLANPRMGDQLDRLCRRGSTKIPNYLLPSVRAALDDDRPHGLLVLAIAGWMRFLRGYDYAGEEMPVQGPRMHLIDIAKKAGSDPRPLLAEEDVFGGLGSDQHLIGELQGALRALDETGPREVLQQYLDESGATS